MVSILQPPKLYLDTCHLIRLADLRKGKTIQRTEFIDAYLELADCIRNRHFGLIFSPWGPMEWVDGNSTLERAYEIADVVESAALQYEIDDQRFIWLREIIVELSRIAPTLRLPEFEFLFLRDAGSARRPLSVLINVCPDFFAGDNISAEGWRMPEEIPFMPIRSCVDRAWKFRFEHPKVYQERIDGYRAAISRDLETLGRRTKKSVTQRDLKDWIKRYLRVQRIFDSLNPHIDLDSLLDRIAIERCPALDLSIKAYEHRIKAGHAPKRNDAGDWAYVPFIPYADVVLSERSLIHFVKQANREIGAKKITHDPNEALQILSPWLTD